MARVQSGWLKVAGVGARIALVFQFSRQFYPKTKKAALMDGLFWNVINLCVGFGAQNLATFIHAGLQVDVVWTAKFAGHFVFNPGHSLHFLAGAAHANAATSHFFAWNSHFKPLKSLKDCDTAESTDKTCGAYSEQFQRRQVR
jgi:hypothetical protein